MNIINKIEDYKSKHKSKVFALRDWTVRNSKKFGYETALLYLFKYAKGDEKVVTEIIEQLTDKKTPMGRTQVYGSETKNGADIVVVNGDLELRGYIPGKEERKKGQHHHENSKIFRKSDEQTSKTYQNAENRMMDLGKLVRELYPSESNSFITMAMQSIKKYSAVKKINAKRVVDMLKRRKLAIDDSDFSIVPVMSESRIIKIDESMFRLIKEQAEMTEYRFNSNIKNFLKSLLDDPVHAEPSDMLKLYGYTRSKLLRELIKNSIIERDSKISDKDENGELKKVTMMVKFRVPKKDFKHKLKKMYIKLFEKNVPDNHRVDEDGEACGATSADASGQYSQPVFPMQRRKIYAVDETTDTCSVGNYDYDVPFIGDKDTLVRKNGKYGSVSIPRSKE